MWMWTWSACENWDWELSDVLWVCQCQWVGLNLSVLCLRLYSVVGLYIYQYILIWYIAILNQWITDRPSHSRARVCRNTSRCVSVSECLCVSLSVWVTEWVWLSVISLCFCFICSLCFVAWSVSTLCYVHPFCTYFRFAIPMSIYILHFTFLLHILLFYHFPVSGVVVTRFGLFFFPFVIIFSFSCSNLIWLLHGHCAILIILSLSVSLRDRARALPHRHLLLDTISLFAHPIPSRPLVMGRSISLWFCWPPIGWRRKVLILLPISTIWWPIHIIEPFASDL